VWSWTRESANRPTSLDHQGSASSWWNNLKAEKKSVKPGIADGAGGNHQPQLFGRAVIE